MCESEYRSTSIQRGSGHELRTLTLRIKIRKRLLKLNQGRINTFKNIFIHNGEQVYQYVLTANPPCVRLILARGCPLKLKVSFIRRQVFRMPVLRNGHIG